jgi:hypothetical protein
MQLRKKCTRQSSHAQQDGQWRSGDSKERRPRRLVFWKVFGLNATDRLYRLPCRWDRSATGRTVIVYQNPQPGRADRRGNRGIWQDRCDFSNINRDCSPLSQFWLGGWLVFRLRVANFEMSDGRQDKLGPFADRQKAVKAGARRTLRANRDRGVVHFLPVVADLTLEQI